MIYLIGGAPRVGKSTIARKFAKSNRIRYYSIDLLEFSNDDATVIFHNDSTKNILAPIDRIESVIIESKKIIPTLQNFINNVINKNQNIIIEGVSILPVDVSNFIESFGKHNFKVVFIGSIDIELILSRMKRNTSKNN